MDFFVDFEKKDGTMLTKLFIGSDAWTKAIEFLDAAKTFGCQSQGPYQTYLESDNQRPAPLRGKIFVDDLLYGDEDHDRQNV
jgi:hypothetical protein